MNVNVIPPATWMRDEYVIEGEDTVYMVEAARFKTYKAAHLSLSLPLSYAVEKNKLFIRDLDRNEYGDPEAGLEGRLETR